MMNTLLGNLSYKHQENLFLHNTLLHFITKESYFNLILQLTTTLCYITQYYLFTRESYFMTHQTIHVTPHTYQHQGNLLLQNTSLHLITKDCRNHFVVIHICWTWFFQHIKVLGTFDNSNKITSHSYSPSFILNDVYYCKSKLLIKQLTYQINFKGKIIIKKLR